MRTKQQGTPFSTHVQARANSFRYLPSADKVQRYGSSDRAVRSFCVGYGTKLTFEYTGLPDRVWIAAGPLDGDLGLRPAAHIFARSKAPWIEITDGSPQHAGPPPELLQED